MWKLQNNKIKRLRDVLKMDEIINLLKIIISIPYELKYKIYLKWGQNK